MHNRCTCLENRRISHRVLWLSPVWIVPRRIDSHTNIFLYTCNVCVHYRFIANKFETLNLCHYKTSAWSSTPSHPQHRQFTFRYRCTLCIPFGGRGCVIKHNVPHKYRIHTRAHAIYVEHSSRALQIIPKLQFTNEHQKAATYMYTGAHKHYWASRVWNLHFFVKSDPWSKTKHHTRKLSMENISWLKILFF